jgi:acetyl esterase
VPLQPDARALIDQLQSISAPVETLTPAEARRASDERRAQSAAEVEPVHDVADITIDGPGGPLRLRLYRPSEAIGLPVVVFFHGGGWVLCDLDSHDGLCRTLTNAVGAVVVSVDYRRAPESRYPAAVQDAYAATDWVATRAGDLGIDASRLAVAGDSAGGNLAASVTLVARDRGGPDIAHQLLIYPVTDHDFGTASYREFGVDHYLTAAAMSWYWNQYVPEPDRRAEPYAAPLRAADLSGLPDAIVVTAECDPLRDEGHAYARRLRAAGVPVDYLMYEGAFHGFFSLAASLSLARAAIREVTDRVRRRLAADRPTAVES